jgi:ABC-type antimicrobial peptide transport system permease subunit
LGYLVCEKCGSNYKLKEGEAIDDFEGCYCGGKFEYVKELDEKSISDNRLNKDDKLICPDCGKENLKNVKFCGSCGIPLNINYSDNSPPKKIMKTMNPINSDINKNNGIKIIAIISGIFTAIIIFFIIYFLSIYIIPALFAGIVVGFFTHSEHYVKNILYGAITSFIGIFICYLVIDILSSSYFSLQYVTISIQPLQIVEILILAIALGAVGGLIGSYLRKRVNIKTN